MTQQSSEVRLFPSSVLKPLSELRSGLTAGEVVLVSFSAVSAGLLVCSEEMLMAASCSSSVLHSDSRLSRPSTIRALRTSD